MAEDGKSYDYRKDTCRNVVTISEILYGTGVDAAPARSTSGNSAAIREACLQEALNCTGATATDTTEGYCLREWKKTPKTTDATNN